MVGPLGVEVGAGCAAGAEVSGTTGGGAPPPQAGSIKTSETTRIKIPDGPVLFPLIIFSFQYPLEIKGLGLAPGRFERGESQRQVYVGSQPLSISTDFAFDRTGPS